MTDQAAREIRRVIDSPAFQLVRETLAAEHDRTVQDIVTLTEIAAPSFQEATRAAAFAEMARAHGLESLETDAEGNVMGLRRGIGNGPLICVAAHLDTVFPPGTDLTVRREGTRLFAPGVGDDTRSLAVLLAWLRARWTRPRSAPAPTSCSLPMWVRKVRAICAACATCSSRAATRIASARSSPWTARTWSASPPAASGRSAIA